MRGCDRGWCASDDERAKLVSLTDLKPGTTVTSEGLDRARTLLSATGFFADVTTSCELRSDTRDVRVFIDVRRRLWVRRITIRGNQALFDADVRKKLQFVRIGGAWGDEVLKSPPPDPPADTLPSLVHADPDVQRQEEAILRLYQREGFEGTQVAIQASEIADEPDAVAVIVTIREGKKAKVTIVDVTFSRVPDERAQSPFGVNIQCPKLTASQIRDVVDISRGEVYTKRKRLDAFNRVAQKLRGLGVVDADIDIDYDPATGVVKVDVAYDRCYVIRFEVRQDGGPARSGFSLIEDKDATDALTFKESRSFDLEEAKRSRVTLETYYRTQGYLFADVVLEYRRTPGLDRAQPGVHGLITYYITLNYVVEIRGIRVHGNKGMTDAAVIALMTTQTYDFFGTGGYLIVETMLADLQTIRKRYRELGYYQMRYPYARKPEDRRPVIQSRRFSDKDSEYVDYTLDDLQFRVEKSKNEPVVYLHIDVAEGPVSRVDHIELAGVPPEAMTDVRMALSLEPGEPYSWPKVHADQRRIERFFQARGYHRATTKSTCVAWEAGVALESCDPERVQAGTVAVRHEVTLGTPVVVGEIFVRGNTRTSRSLITRGLPRPGEPLNRSQLDEVERTLRSLGVFTNVEIQTVGLKEVAPIRTVVALVVVVEERRAQFLDLSVGFQSLSSRTGDTTIPPAASSVATSQSGLIDNALQLPIASTPIAIPDLLYFLGLEYRHLNFLGQAWELRVPARYGFSTPFSTSALHRLADLRPTLYHPFLGESDVKLEWTPLGFVRYDRASKPFDEFEVGAEVRVIKRFFDRLSTVASTTVSGIMSGDFVTGNTVPMEPKVSVELSATLDYLDSPVNPSRGFAVSGRVSYINKRNETTQSFNNFLKWDFSAKAFLSLRRILTLGVYLRYADSERLDDNPLPDDVRYFLGGIQGVRGLDDAAVRPFDANGTAGNASKGGEALITGTFEVRFPVIRRLWAGELWGAAFFDWGALGQTRDGIVGNAFKLSAGLGVRYLVAGQIPIRFDFAFNLRRSCKTGSEERDCIREALGTPSFGVLYSF